MDLAYSYEHLTRELEAAVKKRVAKEIKKKYDSDRSYVLLPNSTMFLKECFEEAGFKVLDFKLLWKTNDYKNWPRLGIYGDEVEGEINVSL